MTTDSQPSPRSDKLWLIPLGCGCGCLSLVVGIVLFGIGGITTLFAGLVKSSGPYQTYQIAAERLKTDPVAIAALGEPISPGWISRSTSNETPTTGTTCIRFSVNGSRTSGTAYVEAEKIAGAWNYYQFTLSVNGQPQPLVLVKPPANRPAFLCPDFDAPPSTAPGSDSVYKNAPIAPLT
ncbi:MAG: cytochrome c oxidase assembly factor Coa1 family protein [Oculatellaceae cyanobacterium bins.114]|nr:cytochrome c oxidase assembly factor Coa1 family protein [Oculatellaceae cyanobacterium bins.114]